jgi:hypothetical protein
LFLKPGTRRFGESYHQSVAAAKPKEAFSGGQIEIYPNP